MALWKFGQPFNKHEMMAIYCYGQAVGGMVFIKHQLLFSSLFYIVKCSKNRHRINIRPYGGKFYH